MVNGLLKTFFIDIYSLLDHGVIMSFVTPLVGKMFDILPYIIHEPFIMSTLVVSQSLQKVCIEIVL